MSFWPMINDVRYSYRPTVGGAQIELNIKHFDLLKLSTCMSCSFINC